MGSPKVNLWYQINQMESIQTEECKLLNIYPELSSLVSKVMFCPVIKTIPSSCLPSYIKQNWHKYMYGCLNHWEEHCAIVIILSKQNWTFIIGWNKIDAGTCLKKLNTGLSVVPTGMKPKKYTLFKLHFNNSQWI